VGAAVGFGVAALPDPPDPPELSELPELPALPAVLELPELPELPAEPFVLPVVFLLVLFADAFDVGLALTVGVLVGVTETVSVGVGVSVAASVGVLDGTTVGVVVSVALRGGDASSALTGCEGLLRTFTVTATATTAAHPDKINIVCSFFISLSPLSCILYNIFLQIFIRIANKIRYVTGHQSPNLQH
jgi:hypothetical protein